MLGILCSMVARVGACSFLFLRESAQSLVILMYKALGILIVMYTTENCFALWSFRAMKRKEGDLYC